MDFPWPCLSPWLARLEVPVYVGERLLPARQLNTKLGLVTTFRRLLALLGLEKIRVGYPLFPRDRRIVVLLDAFPHGALLGRSRGVDVAPGPQRMGRALLLLEALDDALLLLLLGDPGGREADRLPDRLARRGLVALGHAGGALRRQAEGTDEIVQHLDLQDAVGRLAGRRPALAVGAGLEVREGFGALLDAAPDLVPPVARRPQDRLAQARQQVLRPAALGRAEEHHRVLAEAAMHAGPGEVQHAVQHRVGAGHPDAVDQPLAHRELLVR